VLLEIDWQGARQVRAQMTDTVSIFILPPSRAELERRLRARAADSEAVIRRRLADSRADIAHAGEFDYLIVNDDFAAALAELRAIVTARRLRCATQGARHAALLEDLLRDD
jgi:guanylate kinase